MGSTQRQDPIDLLIQQESTRLPWLLPVRHSRMAESPFAFYRGAAAVMAADLASAIHSDALHSDTPHSKLMVQLCGDAHLLNFGFYASAERQLLFDINDFDETHPGPFEWDVLRLAGSLVLAARSIGLNEAQQQKVCRRGLRAYGKAMATFAAMPFLEMWVWRPDLERLIQESDSTCLRRYLPTVLARARRRDSRQAAGKLCESDGHGGLRFRHDPPLLWRFSELESRWHGGVELERWLAHGGESYRNSLRPEMQHLLGRFRLVDVALKAVGVGSVGTRCAIGLLQGDSPGELLILQSKQAVASVLAPYLPATAATTAAPPDHQGERVVRGQRLMQTASDAFLGWATNLDGQQFYRRHFRDWKGSVDLAKLDGAALTAYGKLCAQTLAKAHARSGDRHAIAAHIGAPKHYARQLLPQAVAHADQAEHDHRALLQAIADGRLTAHD